MGEGFPTIMCMASWRRCGASSSSVFTWCRPFSVVGDDDLPDLHILRAIVNYVQSCEKTTPSGEWERLDRAKFMYGIALSSHLPNSWFSPATKQRIIDATKSLLDIANESADAFPPLKSCLGGINALIKYYEVRLQLIAHDLAEVAIPGM